MLGQELTKPAVSSRVSKSKRNINELQQQVIHGGRNEVTETIPDLEVLGIGETRHRKEECEERSRTLKNTSKEIHCHSSILLLILPLNPLFHSGYFYFSARIWGTIQPEDVKWLIARFVRKN